MRNTPFFKWSAYLVFGWIIWGSCSSIPSGAVPVKPFDPAKYLGKWYELARLDYKYERNMSNTTAQYSTNEDGTLRVENRGYDEVEKEWKQATGKAKLVGEGQEARLKVSFFGPFYAGYNVIALDKDYRYALVAGGSLKYLWILSRETTIPEEIKQTYLKLATDLGYNTSALIWVSHDKN